MTFVMDAIRAFLSLIDKVVFWLLERLINVFDVMASVKLFSDPVIEKFATRIFAFVAIIMIFKLSFSIIQYIINPDNFGDKERGFGKIIQNILITLVSLVFVQDVFKIAYDFQGRILSENVIPNIILGVQNVDEDEQKQVKNNLPFLILSPFFTPNTEISGISFENEDYKCGAYYMYKSTASTSFNTSSMSYAKNDYNTNFTSCMVTKAEGEFNASKYELAMKNNDYWALLDNATMKSADNHDVYLFNYKMLVSTLAGAFMVIMYINFCIDLAIRVAKLGFLQLIAPIPIISMVDPKSSKSGMMSKWVKQCLSTYAGLFIRIAAVNFVIYIIYIIMDPSFFSNLNAQAGTLGGEGEKIFVQLLIIFGAFMFAKELPKMISDLTGIDLKGDFNLNPFKRAPKELTALGGRLGSAAGSAAIGGLLGAYAGARSMHDISQANHLSRGKVFAKGAGGMVRGLLRGAGSGLGTGLKNGKPLQSLKNGKEAGQKVGQRNYKLDGTTFAGRAKARKDVLTGHQTDFDVIEKDIADEKEYASFFDQIKSQADFFSGYKDASGNDVDLLGEVDYMKDIGLGAPTSMSALQAAATAADTNLNSAQATYNTANRNYENLRTSRRATQAQITAALAALTAAESGLKTAEAAKVTADKNLDVGRAASKGVKGLKEYYQALQQSGNASTQELSEAKDMYESAQRHVVTNAHTYYAANPEQNGVARQLQTLKNYAAAKATEIGRVDANGNDILTTKAMATYDELKISNINANNAVTNTPMSREYKASKAEKDIATGGK